MRAGAAAALLLLLTCLVAGCSSDAPWRPTAVCDSAEDAAWLTSSSLNQALLTTRYTTIPDVDVHAVWLCRGEGRLNVLENWDLGPTAMRWTAPGRLTIVTSGDRVTVRPLRVASAPEVQVVRTGRSDFERRASQALGSSLDAADVASNVRRRPCQPVRQWADAQN